MILTLLYLDGLVLLAIAAELSAFWYLRQQDEEKGDAYGCNQYFKGRHDR